MRHRVHGRKLGRTSAHRKALFRNQLNALFTHERIITTVAKAKELRPLAERMVTLARTGTLPARRKVLSMVPDKETVTRLFDDIAPRFMDRPGGYTRIMRLGRRRGDGAELAIIEFVDYELAEKSDEGAGGGKKKSLMDRAKGMFGGGAKADQTEETAPADDSPLEEPEAAAEQDAPVEEPEVAADDAVEDEAEAEAEEAAVEDEPVAEAETPAEDEAEEVEEEKKKDE